MENPELCPHDEEETINVLISLRRNGILETFTVCYVSFFKQCFILSQTETATGDAEIQNEYSRQREHLERSVASLRKKLAKDSEIHRADNVRIMQVRRTVLEYVFLPKIVPIYLFIAPLAEHLT